MAEKFAEKRRFIWTITNYSRENVNEYAEAQFKESAPFEITLGNNHTKWAFYFYPKYKDDCCGFFIQKIKTDNNNFSVFLKVTNRDKCFTPIEFLRNAEDIKPGLGWSALSRNRAIIEDKNQRQPNNTLELLIELKIRQNCSSKESPQSNTNDSAVSPDWTINLFNSKDLHDITLVCSDGTKMPAHRCVLVGCSSVFKAMLAAKKSKSIAIDDIDSETMVEVLRFMYTNKVENLDKIASKTIYAAEKYDLQKLKSLCAASLISQITSENVFEMAALADRYNAPNMMHKCMAFIDENYWALKNSNHLNEMSNDLMLKCMQYAKELTSDIILPAASL